MRFISKETVSNPPQPQKLILPHLASVILGHTVVDVVSMRLVEDFSRVWVPGKEVVFLHAQERTYMVLLAMSSYIMTIMFDSGTP